MAAAGGCFFRIKESYASLSPKEQQIADYLTQHPRQASGMSLEELAQACGSSVSSVMRLCKALKLSGYKELMKSLCGELSVLEENREFEDIHPGDDPEAVMSHLLTSDFGALRTTMEMNDAAELERAVSLLCRARRTDFYGVGSSGLVALDASNKFGRIGKVAVANTDPHNQYITSLSLRKGDAAAAGGPPPAGTARSGPG